RAGSSNTSWARRETSRSVRTLGNETLSDPLPGVLSVGSGTYRTSARADRIVSLSQVRARSHLVSAAISARAYPSRKATYELKLLTVTSTVNAPLRASESSACRISDDLP